LYKKDTANGLTPFPFFLCPSNSCFSLWMGKSLRPVYTTQGDVIINLLDANLYQY